MGMEILEVLCEEIKKLRGENEHLKTLYAEYKGKYETLDMNYQRLWELYSEEDEKFFTDLWKGESKCEN